MLPVGEQHRNQLSGEQFGKIFFKVLKICLLFDPVIPLLGICPEEVIKQAHRNGGTRHSPQHLYRQKKKKTSVKPMENIEYYETD